MTTRIILVDDHPVVLAGLRALVLDMPDFELVGQASCAAEALALVRGQRPDLAVLDMGLPGMSGLTLAERILEEMPDTLIVMLTHYEEPSYVQKALRAGIRGYVLKASAGDKVAQALRTVLSGGVYIDSDLEDFRSEWIRKLCPTAGMPTAAASDTLTYREMQVLRLAAVGHSNKEIARRVGLGIKSVETYRYRACKKLMLHSRLDIIRYGASHGWILDV
ncbi:response regulator transcription factor [Bosea sp. (in: a-proteobacteria)]|uniref:response regulator transcription factor n=1 Tax=Bosea sp. (in: a-proteobacteria) TaxID=1871050 RepID=UPI002DDD0FFC|nr:response regulator transcription factor [Bosea sp. (in: a-proteobacteria)]HEV2509954.1 response regulator transcription factor [Bosea sp. (in: a-proteobacteria)]